MELNTPHPPVFVALDQLEDMQEMDAAEKLSLPVWLCADVAACSVQMRKHDLD